MGFLAWFPVTVPEIGIAALAAALLVVAVWFEIWHRQERARIEQYRSRLKDRLARRDADLAYARELAVRPLGNAPRDESAAA